MRRLAAALIVPTAAVAVLAGCGSSTPSAPANSAVTVSGSTGKAPKVAIPATAPTKALATKTVIAGHGQKLVAGDSFLANFQVYVWHGKTHKLLFSSFTSTPEVLPVTMGLSGLERALNGQRTGGRVLAVLPPKYGYGAAGNSQAGIGPTDTMVWVVDPIQVFGPDAAATGAKVSTGGGKLPTVTGTTGGGPSISIPKSAPPAKLVVKTLIQGAGAPLKAGQTIIVKYTGELWRNGQVFDTDWPTSTTPQSVPRQLVLGQEVPGFNTGLTGARIGSRVLLVIPPAEGYGKSGQSQAGIKGTDTLVFVVDVLGVA